jgi:integral membrane sensor domain MASE1
MSPTVATMILNAHAAALSPFGKGFFVSVLVAVVYCLAAQLGLQLRPSHDGIAVFWPASGLAAGWLVFRNGHDRIATAFAIVIATIFSNWFHDRPLELMLGFGLCNALEAQLFASLLVWIGRGEIGFGSLASAVKFLVAATAATSISASSAASLIVVFGASKVEWLTAAKEWWLSDFIGIIVFAPAFVMINQSRTALGDWRSNIESLLILLLLSIIAFLFYSRTGLNAGFDY